MSAHKYHDLRAVVYEDPDESATEASDIPGFPNEQQSSNEKRGDNQSRRSVIGRLYATACSLRGLFDTILLLVIVGLLLERRSSRPGASSQGTYGQLEGSGDITGFAPRSELSNAHEATSSLSYTDDPLVVSQQIKTFKPDFSFAPENASEFFSPEVQNKWLEMVPSTLTSRTSDR